MLGGGWREAHPAVAAIAHAAVISPIHRRIVRTSLRGAQRVFQAAPIICGSAGREEYVEAAALPARGFLC